eukprot:m.103347 g.103347  ORF g.103347 m.103347 type:complete len:357 (+) comp9053_c0_seq2:4191-5261(+)
MDCTRSAPREKVFTRVRRVELRGPALGDLVRWQETLPQSVQQRSLLCGASRSSPAQAHRLQPRYLSDHARVLAQGLLLAAGDQLSCFCENSTRCNDKEPSLRATFGILRTFFMKLLNGDYNALARDLSAARARRKELGYNSTTRTISGSPLTSADSGKSTPVNSRSTPQLKDGSAAKESPLQNGTSAENLYTEFGAEKLDGTDSVPPLFVPAPPPRPSSTPQVMETTVESEDDDEEGDETADGGELRPASNVSSLVDSATEDDESDSEFHQTGLHDQAVPEFSSALPKSDGKLLSPSSARSQEPSFTFGRTESGNGFVEHSVDDVAIEMGDASSPPDLLSADSRTLILPPMSSSFV